MTELSAHALSVQALLFAEGGPLSLRKLGQLTGMSGEELAQALEELSTNLEGTGLALVRTDTECSLTTSKEASEIVEQAFQDSLARDIGDAGLEVIAIVLYRGQSTRATIDHIRGVNTGSTIRNLVMRGLLERTQNKDDAREILYRPTAELLAHLGVEEISELPQYDTIRTEILAFEAVAERAEEDHAEGRTGRTD